MFSFGQLIFALCFFIVFIGVIIFSYKTDKKSQPNYFKGSYKILVGFFIAFGILLFIKYATH
tara:strand:- start:4079 stop:4264 length:186 start_codon:yes stop_codon:yes gene_type:complete